MLATASIGAIWTSCSPDYGWRGVLDRFRQLEPKVLFCSGGYCYGGQEFDRRGELRQIIAGLPGPPLVVSVPRPGQAGRSGRRAGLGRAARPPRGRRRGVRGRAGPVRPPAVGPVLLRNHRAAQGDRAQPRRDPAGADEAAAPAHGPAAGRPDVLLHHHRLDDVELPGQLAAAGRAPGAVRRQPGVPRAGRAVAGGPGLRCDLLRCQPGLREPDVQGRGGARGRLQPAVAARDHAGRLAGVRGLHRVVLRQRQAGRMGGHRQRRDRRVHGLRRRRADAAGLRGRDPGPAPRRGRAGAQ